MFRLTEAPANCYFQDLTIPSSASGGPASKNRNINQQEAQFIVSELLQLKEQGSKMSVGIITPHTDQQNYWSTPLENCRSVNIYTTSSA